MNALAIFVVVYLAMIAMGFWEAYVEGRNPWHLRKLGWKLKLTGKFVLPAYHFFLFMVMWPLLLSLPLVIYGWDTRLFGILVSAYVSGTVIEDFAWFVVNPVVKLREFWTEFSDYYPWIIVRGRKIVPASYVFGFAVSVLSWYLFWR